MKIGQWVKIGESVKSNKAFSRGLYARYAIMERIDKDGFRRYKEVLMCTWTEEVAVKSQPEISECLVEVYPSEIQTSKK